MSNGEMLKIQDITAVQTSELVYDLVTCWDEYLAHKACYKGCPNEIDEIDEMMPLLLEAAAGRLLTYKRTIRFITIGLITTNLLWVLNTVGVI